MQITGNNDVGDVITMSASQRSEYTLRCSTKRLGTKAEMKIAGCDLHATTEYRNIEYGKRRIQREDSSP